MYTASLASTKTSRRTGLVRLERFCLAALHYSIFESF
jgi:hypothetical protein